MIGSPPSVHPDRQRSRMTTADGRSPGSRVYTLRRLPGTRDPSGHVTEDSPLTVAGAAAELGDASPAPRSLLIPKRGNRRFKAYWRGPKPSISMSLVGPNSDLPQCRHFGRYHVQSRRGMTTSAMRARQHMSAPTQRRLIGFQQQQLVIGFERHRIDERSRGRPSHRGELPGATKHATKRRLCV